MSATRTLGVLLNWAVNEVARFYRLAQLRDALSRLGRVLYRGSFKYTFITSVATSIGHELPTLGLPGLQTAIAVGLPAVVFLLAFGGGLTLRYLPTIISLGQMTTAEAADYNLMKDYRKAEMDEHLDMLWQRIFQYEARVRYDDEEIQAERDIHEKRLDSVRQAVEKLDSDVLSYLGVHDTLNRAQRRQTMERLVEALLCARPQCDEVEKTRRAFVTSAKYALNRHLHQEAEAAEIGFDVSQWEDWRDSAYFHSTDNHLKQQYDANPTLNAIKREVGWTGSWNLRRLAKKAWQRLWSRLTARALSIQLGAQLAELNERYRTAERPNRFKAQILMWPGGEKEVPWMERLASPQPEEDWNLSESLAPLRRLVPPNSFLARALERLLESARTGENPPRTPREDVVERRRYIIRERFGRNYEEAKELIDRIYLIPFELATELRLAYDAEYAAGMLHHTPADDYEQAGGPEDEVKRLQRRTEDVRGELEDFLALATQLNPDAEESEARRALATAFWVNSEDVRTRYRQQDTPDEELRDAVNEIVERKALYSDRLYALRMHQTLTLMQIKGARRYIRLLAYPTAADDEYGPSGTSCEVYKARPERPDTSRERR